MELGDVSNFIIEGNAPAAEQWTQSAIDEGMDPLVIVNEGLIPGMDVVGERFKNGEYYLPEVLVSARAMKWAMNLVRPLLAETQGASLGKVVIGTVRGDLHDIGKNLVSMMLDGAGFEVVDLGNDVSPEQFLEAVEESDANMICMSALLTTTMPIMKTTIEMLEQSEIRQNLRVMVGGAPVTQHYASDIGADGYAPEAATAVEVAKELLGVEK
ncbi:MAG: cobalamin-binding protein [SAR202 cluster bacterium]|jgi:5-methyltetrahydrofolate--homocysteine methyltransferase|nr:cobalamin-binding protein [Chloroflexota bacterium]MDP6420822.1 corrinoid protein [SAR202 cluster bacterium]MDP6662444.1 corrinoid protein [SAR202 cluster bacterium]MDP6799773.1 corrinoid protein [SAR202 cluster bacterium]MQG58281.1 cobalamin-binding protein [SAR202 cluster bacterium]|tara:strand:+ start:513 stop:1151 length:639 start_codon:yes stop_codon:yes gene_type:complete